ncbi:MAG: sulfatase-like hydrolase/transferase [Prevotella sp.]|nr:sulfatase-like hydrolase/transferase [Prevotella sp.]
MNYKFSSPLLLLPAVAAAQEADERPNIMLIVVDDMGYSDLQCFGGEVETPNINGLADNGIRFTQFFNCGRSCPSRASLLTGMYAQQVGITGMGLSLTKDCVTIPEALKTAGYHTAMSGKWHLSLTQGIGNKQDQMAWLSHQNTFDNRPFAPLDTYPCNRGFDEHWGTIWGVVNHFDPFSLVHNEEPIYTDAIPDDFYSTDYITTKAIDMLDDLSKEQEPFFMYVSYNAPHWPLHAKPEDIAKYKGKYDEGWDVLRQQRYQRMVSMGIIDPEETPMSDNESGRAWENESNKAMMAANMEVHAAMIDCVDQGIGRILDKLKSTGEYENTIIIFTSDNGASPENYEIGDFDRHDRTRSGQMVTRNAQVPGSELTYNYLGNGWAGAVNTPFRYWKAESFHGGTASPTIIQWPAGMKARHGSIVKDPCHYIDVMPTCLEVAHATYPEIYNGNKIQPLVAEGRSLMPLLEGASWQDERTMFWEHENGRAVRVGDWKMTSLRNGGWQLFNMKNDYSETNNIAAEHPEKVRELKNLWNEWAKSVGLNVTNDIPDTEKQLVFYYPFDGTLDDGGDNAYTLTPAPGGYSFAEGKQGQSLSLNGNGQYVDLNTTGLVNTQNTQYTLCCWIYDEETAIPTSGTSQDGFYFRDEVIMAQKDNAGTGRIILYTRIETPTVAGDTRYIFNNFLGGNQNRSSDGAFRRGVWQHVAVVCNPADRNVTFYVDGERDRTVSTSAFEACTGGFRIGGHKANKDYWHGRIDELYFFRGLLTPDEIRQVRDGNYITNLRNVEASRFAISYDAKNSLLTANSPTQRISIYTATGQSVVSADHQNTIALDTLPHGTYLVTATDLKGNLVSRKINR